MNDWRVAIDYEPTSIPTCPIAVTRTLGFPAADSGGIGENDDFDDFDDDMPF